ncbi:MAG: VWA domain-containing protein [Bacteroidales bacterium]
MEIIQFEHTIFLYGLALIPLLVLFHIATNYRRRKKINALADNDLYIYLTPQASNTRRNWKFTLFVMALFFLIVALANPQIGSKMEKAEKKGVDLIVALDVSRSMLATDLSPNRLASAKRALNRLINRLEGDRIGLVIFAGQAYKQFPITTDYAAAKMFLQAVSTEIAPTQGTAIGEAIEKSINSMNDKADNNQAVIVISDGENHEDNPLQMAEKAAEKGIIIHTIGIGSLKGAPIPISNRPGTGRYLQDNKGNTVISQLNQQMLQDIAKAGNGTYIHASNTKTGVNALYEEVQKMKAKEFDTLVYADYEDRFQYPLAIALLLLIIEHLMYNRKSPWLQKFKLFADDDEK